MDFVAWLAEQSKTSFRVLYDRLAARIQQLARECRLVVVDRFLLQPHAVVHPGRLHRDVWVVGTLRAEVEQESPSLLQLAQLAKLPRPL